MARSALPPPDPCRRPARDRAGRFSVRQGPRGADSVDITGSVDVPLYSAPTGGSAVGVFLTVGEDRFLLRVLPGQSSISLTPAASGLDLKVRDVVNDQTHSYIEIEEATLGDASLRDLQVLTSEVQTNTLSDEVWQETLEGVDFDGHIGLAALTEHISGTAPRRGRARIAPASGAQRLGTRGRHGRDPQHSFRETEVRQGQATPSDRPGHFGRHRRQRGRRSAVLGHVLPRPGQFHLADR